MEDSRNDTALPKEGESQSPREQAPQKNHTINAAAGEPPPAACRTHPVKSRHTAKSTTGAEAPQSSPNGQQEPKKKKGKPGRESPFDPFWDTEILPLLEPDLAAKITPAGILDHLLDRHPEAFEGKQRKSLLKTLGRRIKEWRAKYRRGLPERWKPCPRSRGSGHRSRRRMIFPQDHPPGREVQVDFTDCKKLEVTIQGKPFPHELFDFRMSHSGWTYVEVFRGETVSALMQGLQNAMRKLGGVPQVVRSDNRGNIIRYKQPIEPYRMFLKHYGLELSLINHKKPNENGGVEGENGRVKTRIKQALLIRGSRDFESEEDYAAFVNNLIDRGNRRHEVQHQLKEERASFRPLPETAAPEYVEKQLKVNNLSLINVYSCRYSVPCQAVGKMVTVRLYAERLEVDSQNGLRLADWPRLHENNQFIINPYHCFPDLMSKWGSFAGLPPDYKKQMFPRPSFRMTYDKLREWDPNGKTTNGLTADYQYVRILHLASQADQEEAVDQALQQLLKAGPAFGFEDVRRLVAPPSKAPEGSVTERFDPPKRNAEPPSQKPFF